MANPTTTNLTEIYIATNKVKRVTSATLTFPERPVVKSDELTDGAPEVLGLGSVTEPTGFEFECELDPADTTGQVALIAAHRAGTSVASVEYHENGKSTGAPKVSGAAYVTKIPDVGSSGNNNKSRKGKFKLTFVTATVGVST
jgi:hypothetical protein